MARKVTGFMAEDGSFHESEADAEYHDARAVVDGLAMAEGYNIGKMGYIDWMEKNYAEVKRFVEAIEAKRETKDVFGQTEAEFNAWAEREDEDELASIESDRSQDDTDPPDDTGGEEVDARAQQQPVVSGEYVSDVGRCVSPEEIRNKRSEHGARSRKPHARRVRSRKNLATGTPAEPKPPRSSDG